MERDECRNDIYEKTQWAVMSRLTKGIETDVETALTMVKKSNLRIQAARRDHDQTIRELRTSLTMQEKRTDALQAENSELKAQLENAKEEREREIRRTAALKGQNETLKETLEDIRRQMSMLAGEYNILQSQAVTLAESKLELEKTVIGLRKEIVDTRDAYLETERGSRVLLDESRKENESLREEYKETAEKLQQEIASLRSVVSIKKDNERTEDVSETDKTIQEETILKPEDDPVLDMTQQLISNREKIEILSRQNDRLSKTLCRLRQYQRNTISSDIHR
ncbi:myosin-2 heavy chain-like [Bombus pyrosoma]|uniref:myosin-2 heavy chain-like n=1 Tax=Bombus pyrosoma TaxID=396416 RepID=UPI001CB90AE3|nr:myosin-2 heavy chain-like [Bombus pyrosoma]